MFADVEQHLMNLAEKTAFDLLMSKARTALDAGQREPARQLLLIAAKMLRAA